ncbi:MAG: putative poly(beta-D-mannuronate) O-acetylase [Acidimicrobiaceae bacterium]|nr:putative poly(beta-D-mannuronate) O-acetylase [Acidimicrobiaceae bacterium]
MLFPTIDFAIFFGVVFVANWLLAPFPRPWKLMMLGASYVFYGWFDWRDLFLLLASTVFTVAGGRAVARAGTERSRQVSLALTVAADLGLLAWFKYAQFFTVSVDNFLHHLGLHANPLPIVEAVEPIGISFFTFMAISYVVDIYRRSLEPASPLDVAVYLSFFPHLAAGPIVRGSELLPQLARSGHRDPRRIDLPLAAYLIFGGLFKKVVISSYVASAIVDPVFNSPSAHSAPEILLATYGYAVQIYADFSGYTDIAIGCALLLGFRFPQNFDAPYSARSLQDFWRRWHITLSLFLRDYLYVPLGGSRGSRATLYRNLMVTMLLGGLWHGAGWTFIFWGGLHGAGQCVGHWRRSRRVAAGLAAQASSPGARALQRLGTFHFVCLGWIFFRAGSLAIAFNLLRRLFTTWGEAAPLVRFPVIAAIVGALAMQLLPRGGARHLQDAFGRLGTTAKGAVLAVAMLVITTLGPTGVAPYIYFRF